MIFDGVIEKLNLWADHLAGIAWPVIWQSTVLITAMFLFDLLLRRRLRPSVRHALWLVVLVKLLLPPSFALPTGIGWWLRPREAAPAKKPVATYVVTYGAFHEPRSSRREEAPSSFLPVPRTVRFSTPGRALLASAAISATLMLVMLVRWRRLRQQLRESQPAPICLQETAREAQHQARCRGTVRLSLTDVSISPALCGLFTPVIVLPKALVKQLTPLQLRAVLLHELFHLRNRHVWINCFQSLLQIVFWWHPFLWLANARIRRVREEVVDDAVRLALGEEAESYAPTLLEVARLALVRPVATLGFIGILESRNALRQRVERMVSFPAPRRVGLSIISGFAILAFAGVALPMGQAPAKKVAPSRREAPTIYYTFDRSFLDYFGSNGVEAVNHALAQNSDVSNLSQNDAKALGFDYYFGNVLMNNGSMRLQGGTRDTTDPSERHLDSRDLDMQDGLSSSPGFDAAIAGNTGSVAIADSTWELKPLSENGWVDFNFASATTTATNGAILTYGDTSLSADSITVNRETGQIVAECSVQLKKGSHIPLGGKFHSDVTRLFAQNQPSTVAPSRVIPTSSGRRRILNKLEAIRLNHVSFDNLPLSEVVNYLQSEAKKRDPEGKGINFILNPNADLAGPPAVDPATGLQVEAVDINGVAVRISPALEDVRMIDVLDAITKVADKRIRYSIEDYGVSFRLSGNETPVPLFSRTIKVDPNVFAQGLESVVGFSVGNFQTGGQGGGGQGNSGGVTFPRVQVAPNIGGQGGQAGQGGAQSGQGGGISGVTRPTTAITPQAVRQFFVNAGVDLTPPKNVFFNDRAGTLLVHATLNDLDIIEQAVGALSTSAPQPATTRISVQADRAEPATVRLYTNEQFVSEQKVNLSPGKNSFTVPSNPAPAVSNQARLPLAGVSPISGKTQTKTVEVSTANSPQQVANANPGNDEKLVTRILKIDSTTFLDWVRKTAGLADSASSQEIMDAFRKILLDSGLQLAPPANIFYSERNGSLFVRAIAPEMDAIQQIVQELNRSSAQINIRAKFVEVSRNDTNLIAINSDTNGSVVAILTDPQFRAVFHALEMRDGVDVVSEQNVTTLSGRQAQVQTTDVQSIVKLNPQALVSPGVASSNVYVTEPVYSGPVLDIIPYVSEDGDKIQLTIIAKVTEFVGYDAPESGEAVPVFLDGQATTIKPPHPRTHVRTIQTAAVNLYDGQTVVLGRPKDELITLDKEGKPISAPSTAKKNLLVFVTATLIDAAGNPVHRADSRATPQSH